MVMVEAKKQISISEAYDLIRQGYYIDSRPRKGGRAVYLRKGSDVRRLRGIMSPSKFKEFKEEADRIRVKKELTNTNKPNTPTNKNQVGQLGENGDQHLNKRILNLLEEINSKLGEIISLQSHNPGGSPPHNPVDPSKLNEILDTFREVDMKQIELKGIEVTGDLIRNDPFIRLYHSRLRTEFPEHKNIPLPTFLREVVIDYFALRCGWYLSWVDIKRILELEKKE